MKPLDPGGTADHSLTGKEPQVRLPKLPSIGVKALLDDRQGFFCRQDVLYNYAFVFQHLIVFKKTFKYGKPVRRKFACFLIAVVFGVVNVNGDDLVISFVLVCQGH